MTRAQLEESVQVAIDRGLSMYSADALAARINADIDDVTEHVAPEDVREASDILQQEKEAFATAFAQEAETVLEQPTVTQDTSNGNPVMTDGGLALGRDDIMALGFAAVGSGSMSMVDAHLGMVVGGVAVACLMLHFGAKAIGHRVDEHERRS